MPDLKGLRESKDLQGRRTLRDEQEFANLRMGLERMFLAEGKAQAKKLNLEK